MKIFNKTILLSSVALFSAVVSAEDVSDYEDFSEYEDTNREVVVYEKNAAAARLDRSSITYISSVESNLITDVLDGKDKAFDDITGISFAGKSYNDANVAFLYDVNYGYGSAEEDSLSTDVLLLDMGIGIGYALPVSDLGASTGVAIIDGGHILLEAGVGVDVQIASFDNGNATSEIDMSTTYTKLGVGGLFDVTEFVDVYAMITRVSMGKHTVTFTDDLYNETEREYDGEAEIGLTFGGTVYFGNSARNGITFESNHSAHDYIKIGIATRF